VHIRYLAGASNTREELNEHLTLELVIPGLNACKADSLTLSNPVDRKRVGVTGVEAAHGDRRNAWRAAVGAVVETLARVVDDSRRCWIGEESVEFLARSALLIGIRSGHVV
jgi:hypothetical protein